MDFKICMFIKIYILIYRLSAFKHHCVGQIKMYNIMDIAIDDRWRVVSLKFLVGYLSPTYAPEMTEENNGKSRVHLSKLTVAHLDKLTVFYGTRYCLVHNGQIQMNPVHTLSSFFLRLDCFFILGPKFCMCIMLATCPVNHVLLDRHFFFVKIQIKGKFVGIFTSLMPVVSLIQVFC